jgi:hypothetical protein
VASVASAGVLVVDQNSVANVGALVSTNVDGDVLFYSVVSAASNGTVVITDTATGAYTYTPTNGYSGADSFTFKVNDGTVDSATKIITITVSPISIFYTNGAGDATAELRPDGSVITSGNATSGGDSSPVSSDIDGSTPVVSINSSGQAFAALRSDGSVVTWGGAAFGGDSSSVSADLNGATAITSIYSTDRAFAALRSDGSVVTWGDAAFGGDSSSVSADLDGATAVVSISSTTSTFSATRSDGSVITW